jgi:hypothetical protein
MGLRDRYRYDLLEGLRSRGKSRGDACEIDEHLLNLGRYLEITPQGQRPNLYPPRPRMVRRKKMPGRAFFAEPSVRAARSNRNPEGDSRAEWYASGCPVSFFRIDPIPLH